MANPEHLSLIETPEWNAWRSENPSIQPDLSEGDLTGIRVLAEANLADADLSRANLSGVNLAGASFERANLTEANLDAAELAGTDFTDAKLTRATLRSAGLQGSNFLNADLSGAHLGHAFIEDNNNFAGAQLIDADLRGIQLISVDLRKGEPLTAANLSRANLDKANLKGAKIDAEKRPLFPDIATNLAIRSRESTAELREVLDRVAQLWISLMERRRRRQAAYAPDPFAVAARGGPVDRSGRPLPWRWERSLSRDLLGQHGLILVGAALVVATVARTIPVTTDIGRPPAIERPQTPPTARQAQVPSPLQASSGVPPGPSREVQVQVVPPDASSAPATSTPQAQAPTLSETPPKTPQAVSRRIQKEASTPGPVSAPAASTLPYSKFGPPQQPPSKGAGKGAAAK